MLRESRVRQAWHLKTWRVCRQTILPRSLTNHDGMTDNRQFLSPETVRRARQPYQPYFAWPG